MGDTLAVKQTRKLRLLAGGRPHQQVKSRAPNTIAVLLNERVPIRHRDNSIKVETSDFFHLRGDITGRIIQQQAIGTILAVLRGFRILYCRGSIALVAQCGSAECSGTITTFSEQHLEEAEKMVHEARRQMEQFALRYPDSEFKIICSIKTN